MRKKIKKEPTFKFKNFGSEFEVDRGKTLIRVTGDNSVYSNVYIELQDSRDSRGEFPTCAVAYLEEKDCEKLIYSLTKALSLLKSAPKGIDNEWGD